MCAGHQKESAHLTVTAQRVKCVTFIKQGSVSLLAQAIRTASMDRSATWLLEVVSTLQSLAQQQLTARVGRYATT
jgi:hypothetical protein